MNSCSSSSLTRGFELNPCAGVYSVHCDIPSQTVTVSGNVNPQALLKRVKQVKRKSKILSYANLYTDSSYMTGPHHGRTSSSTAAYGNMSALGYHGSSAIYGSTPFYRSPGALPSPPRDHSFYSHNYSYNNHHALSRPGGYDDHYRPSYDGHYTNYY